MTNPMPVVAGKKEYVKNLKPVITHEEAVARGRNGGIQNGRNWAMRRLLKEIALDVLDEQDEDSPAGSDITNAVAILRAMAKKAKGGDVASATFIRDTSGQKPVEKQETTFTGPQPVLVEFEDAKGATVESF